MKNFYLLLFTLFLCSLTHAQSTFEKFIDTLGCSAGACIQQTFDGGFVVCGTSIFNSNDVYIIKLDTVGTVEWAKTYGGPSMDGARHIQQLPDSGYIVDGGYNGGAAPPFQRNYLLRLDQNGDTLWTKKFASGPNGIEPLQLAVTKSVKFGLTGYTNVLTNNPYLLIVDSTGSLLVNKIYTTTYSSVARSIDTIRKNEFMIAGGFGVSSNSGDFYLIRTDSLGDTLWTRHYDHSQIDEATSVNRTSDGGAILGGFTWNNITAQNNPYVIKTKSNGDTIWTRQYNANSEINCIQQTRDGGYIMVGRIVNGTPLNPYLYLIRADQNGDTLWTKKFGGSGPNDGSFVRQTTDGGFIVTGQLAIGLGVYILKIDSLGNVNTPTGKPEINNPFSFTAYPVPSSGLITLQLKGNNYKRATIEIYNLFDQKIYSALIKQINSSMEIDLSLQPKGMYIAVLRYDGKTYSKKVILQ